MNIYKSSCFIFCLLTLSLIFSNDEKIRTPDSQITRGSNEKRISHVRRVRRSNRSSTLHHSTEHKRKSTSQPDTKYHSQTSTSMQQQIELANREDRIECCKTNLSQHTHQPEIVPPGVLQMDHQQENNQEKSCIQTIRGICSSCFPYLYLCHNTEKIDKERYITEYSRACPPCCCLDITWTREKNELDDDFIYGGGCCFCGVRQIPKTIPDECKDGPYSFHKNESGDIVAITRDNHILAALPDIPCRDCVKVTGRFTAGLFGVPYYAVFYSTCFAYSSLRCLSTVIYSTFTCDWKPWCPYTFCTSQEICIHNSLTSFYPKIIICCSSGFCCDYEYLLWKYSDDTDLQNYSPTNFFHTELFKKTSKAICKNEWHNEKKEIERIENEIKLKRRKERDKERKKERKKDNK